MGCGAAGTVTCGMGEAGAVARGIVDVDQAWPSHHRWPGVPEGSGYQPAGAGDVTQISLFGSTSTSSVGTRPT
jgi:hypothetical protein